MAECSPRQIRRIDRATWPRDSSTGSGRDKINDARWRHDIDGPHTSIMMDEVSAAARAATADVMQLGRQPILDCDAETVKLLIDIQAAYKTQKKLKHEKSGTTEIN